MSESPAKVTTRILTVAAVLLGVSSGFGIFQLSKRDAAPAPAIHTVADNKAQSVSESHIRPAFVLSDLNGEPQDVAQWDGRLIVLNFWATWCGPCRHEIPYFIELQRKYESRGLIIVGIAIDTPGNVGPYVTEMGMNYPILLGQSDAIRVGEAYGNKVGGLPYTVFIDQDRRIVKVKSGPFEFDELDQLISELL